MILIITNKLDRHADYVIGKLRERGAEFVRLNTEDFPAIGGIEIRLPGRLEDSCLRIGKRDVALSSIASVWYRKPEPFKIDERVRDHRFRRFATAQFGATLRGLYTLLRDREWVSAPDRIAEAENKILQLQIAQSLGFRIPRTLVTNVSAAALAFTSDLRARGTPCAVKAVASYPSLSAYTQRIDGDTPLESVAYAPCTFQTYVHKHLEVRVNVIGGRVLAAEIHSQRSEKTSTDWRHYDFERVPHLHHSLPQGVQDGCRQLVSACGLRFGAIDLVLEPSGDYTFLELNPNGQWMWIEQLTALPIADAIADVLASAAVPAG